MKNKVFVEKYGLSFKRDYSGFFIPDKYDCVLKSEMRKDWWYSMEPVKLTATIPLTEYFKMKLDIKDCDDNFHFRLLVDKKDNPVWYVFPWEDWW